MGGGCRPGRGPAARVAARRASKPWLDTAVTDDPHHLPVRPAVAVDGKERKLAKAAGQAKVHLLAAVTHVAGLVIGQDKAAKSGKANEITHFGRCWSRCR